MAEEVKPVKAEIVDASVHNVHELWKDKPRSLRFADEDAVIVTAKPAKGPEVKETFYVALNPEGCLITVAQSRVSRARRRKLAQFLKAYITEDIEGYSIAKNVGKWKGKKVDVVLEDEEQGYISIPGMPPYELVKPTLVLPKLRP